MNVFLLCCRLWEISGSGDTYYWRECGVNIGTLAVAGESAGHKESPVWRIHYHALMDRHSCSLRSDVRLYHTSYVLIYLFTFSLLISDVLWPFSRLSSPSQWTVYAGYLNLNQMVYSSRNSVMQVISHPDFDPETNNNDIALMKLWTPLQMSS